MPPAVSPDHTLAHLLEHNATAHPDLPALSWRDGTDWATLTWAEVNAAVARLAQGYAFLGLAPGDRALLMMGNRPEHWLSDLALVHIGAIPTTVYDTAAPEQVAYIVRHSRAKVAIVESAEVAAAWEPLVADPGTALESLVVVSGADPARGHLDYVPLAATPAGDAFERRHDLKPDDLLTVVYTSGTTGDPKGVAVTHRRMLANLAALNSLVDLPEHVDHICYLPLAHIAERDLGLYLPLLRASHVWMCDDPARLVETLRHVRPAQFFGVPRVWEKLTSALRAGIAALPEEYRAGIESAMEVGAEHTARLERGEPIPDDLAERFAAVGELALTPILEKVGLDRVVWASSASAPMPQDAVRFWAGLGVPIMDAWGLTESLGVATVNTPTAGFRLGSVGRPLDTVEVRVTEDGEVLLRGETVFDGYVDADGTVRSAADADGWFATGDIGRLDEDGHLWITDRKKEIIITSGGKNVSPALVENTLKEHPLVGQVYAHGDRRPYLVALVVPDREITPVWAAARGIDTGGDWAELVAHPEVRAELERAVAEANARLNRAEQVKRHRVLAGEWGPDTGELTPSLKLRRRVIRDKYATELNDLYGESAPLS
ncbi:AMP-dependent synthetase/ligase [Nocardiopsis sp. N85]|uniref:AMP-dependent synthetase/ligase n=1 Tax=Nocardiopsis sp. N85 TaxID=3029400 RepID=UPI00237F8868|nr:AMP-dependent synthetase/ligase [Nocardiopsis sp. N85]MDE3722587.1 AMP-dependent synthetase/ligase [Nocardiopsis sp. N85]